MNIEFEFETQWGVYRDAIWTPDGQDLSAEEIEAIKQDRLNKWLDNFKPQPFVETPPSRFLRDEQGNLILDEYGEPIYTGA